MVGKYKKPEGQKLLYDSYDRLLAAWGVSISEYDIETSYGITHVVRAGSENNPPLLLFHGVGDDTALMWIFNTAELSKHFLIYAIDAIGGPGKSQPNEKYFKKIDHGQWIGELLEYLALDYAYAAGVSFGAYLATVAAIKHPSKIKRIVCMAGGIKSDMFGMFKAFLPEALFPTEKNIIKLMKKLAFNANAFLNNEELMLHWRLLLKYFNNRSMMYHPVKAYTIQDLDAIRDRALFLIGDHDILAYSTDKVKALGDSKMNFKIIENAGHGVNHEQPEFVNMEIVSFLIGF